jgi:polyhydroxyalkanoate synthesis regulator phasin
MTRKHFQKFAQILLDLKGKMPEENRKEFVNNLMEMFEGENPRFDKDRFKAACRIE